MKTKIAITILVLQIAFYNVKTHAQWSKNAAENTEIFNKGKNELIVQVSDDYGGTFIVWESNVFNSNNGKDIYAQHINAAGVKLWGAGLVICNAINNQYSPQINTDGYGNALICWTDLRDNQSRIRIQKVSPEGYFQWTKNGIEISIFNGFTQQQPIIAPDGNNGAYIVWMDNRLLGKYYSSLYGQHVDENGTLLWTTEGKSLCSTESTLPKLVSSDNNSFILVWNTQNNLSNSYDIYANKFDENGVGVWSSTGISICSATQKQLNFDITSNGNNGAYVVWEDFRNSIGSENYSSIYIQNISSKGNVIWDNNGIKICAISQNHSTAPKIALDGYYHAVVTWQDDRNFITNGYDIFAQRISPEGKAMWTENGVEVAAILDNQTSPVITSDNVGGTIIAWSDDYNNLDDIYAQNLNKNGYIQWQYGGSVVSNAVKSQTKPSIISNYESGAIVVWTDTRSDTSGGIYCQNILSNGGFNSVKSVNKKVEIKISPNPCTNVISIESATAANIIEISILNLKGQLIFSTANSSQIDISNLNSGIYIALVKNNEGKVSPIKFVKL